MWRTTEFKIPDPKPAEPRAVDSKVSDPKPAARPATSVGPAMEQATLGATMTVKGDVSGSQALYVDGRIEGSIRFPEHRVTIGRTAVVLANIEAKEVVILGSVTGNIECGDRVEIRSDAVVTGDVVTRRISVDEGALVKGKVEVYRGKQEMAEAEAPKTASPAMEAGAKKVESPIVPVSVIRAPITAATVPASAEAPKAATAAAGAQGMSRVGGSSVLFQENKDGK